MALQTSGAISLNDIHIEAGGTTGTTASINDADIRGLISKASGVQMSFSEWYGASSNLWDTTLTLGESIYSDGYTISAQYGFITANVLYTDAGSLSDTTVDFYSGAECTGLRWQDSSIAGNDALFFEVFGEHPNSGWTKISFNGFDFFRTSATAFVAGSITTSTIWRWDTADSLNPFGTTTVGTTFDVVVT